MAQRSQSSLIARLFPPIVAFVAIVALWELATRALEIPIFLLPPPSRIAASAARDGAALATATLTTAKAALTGFTMSAIVGIAAALVLATSRVIERAFAPYTVFLQTVPIVAIAPLLVVWFGPGFRAVVVSSLIVSVFPVIANTLAGLRSVDPALKDLFRLYGATRGATLIKLTLPWAVPNIVTGMRIASGLAVIGTIVGEFVAGSSGDAGLGIIVLAAHRNAQTDLMFAAVLLAAMLGFALFASVNALGALFLDRWRAE